MAMSIESEYDASVSGVAEQNTGNREIQIVEATDKGKNEDVPSCSKTSGKRKQCPSTPQGEQTTQTGVLEDLIKAELFHQVLESRHVKIMYDQWHI